MTLYDKISRLKPKKGDMTPQSRLYCELKYGADLSTAEGGKYDAIVEKAADEALGSLKANGALTLQDVSNAEETMAPLKEDAKRYTAHCVGHAHIDMNWMWGYNETASLTVDTFRTVLKLMAEYPDFCFSQSQASTYRIIEDYAPDMLPEIRQRVHEGRWEVCASTWVENDKNMPTGEAMCRHILYTKRYLSKLLDIKPESIEIDFEPDTFGHAATVPELCKKGGVKYYYHCRGRNASPCAYVWRAKSGSELIVYNEPHWYNTQIEPVLFTDFPQRCRQYGGYDFLMVYGVGDHGGGPTRRDIERIIEIGSWPIMPRIVFSTYSRFFKELEKVKDRLAVETCEQNYMFTGCYTSQSRIKLADSYSQARMREAEFLTAASRLYAGDVDRTPVLSKAWEGILFNQFHDILPGSGTIETREYAMGAFQSAMAGIQASASCALNRLSGAVKLPLAGNEDEEDTTSDGAGAGFATGEKGRFLMPSSARGRGKTRYFVLYNAAQQPYEGVTDVTVWDWEYDAARACFTDADGKEVPSALSENGEWYWTHSYKTFSVKVSVPALGYAAYTLTERGADNNLVRPIEDTRLHDFGDYDIVLENEYVKAVFDNETMLIKSFTDKQTNTLLTDKDTGAFTLVSENPRRHGTAWVVGDRMQSLNLNRACPVRIKHEKKNGLVQSVEYTIAFGHGSKLDVRVTLSAGDRYLKYSASCDFQEIGSEEATPLLSFGVKQAYRADVYRCDIPYGYIDRAPLAHDVPAESFMLARNSSGPSAMILSDCKHGFRGWDDTLSLSLLRGSWDPDPHPENGLRTFTFALASVCDTGFEALKTQCDRLIHAPAVSACEPCEKACLAPRGSFLSVQGARLGAVKLASDGKSLVLRLVNAEDAAQKCTVTLPLSIKAACRADVNENALSALTPDGDALTLGIGAGSVETVIVTPGT